MEPETMRQFDLFVPSEFGDASFAKLLRRVVIVRFSSGVTALGTLQRLGEMLFLTNSPQSVGFVEKVALDVNDIDWVRAFPAEVADLRYLEAADDDLPDFDGAWGTDGRSMMWSNSAGACAELNVEKASSGARFEAFLELSDPDHGEAYSERGVPETRVMQVSTNPQEAARAISAFLKATSSE